MERTAEAPEDRVVEERAEERVAGEEERGGQHESPEWEEVNSGGARAGARRPGAERHEAREGLAEHTEERWALASDFALPGQMHMHRAVAIAISYFTWLLG